MSRVIYGFDPRQYKGWEDAISALVEIINRRAEDVEFPKAPLFLASDLPMDIEPGLLFYVSNATGAVKLAVTTASGYINVNDGSVIL